MSADERHPVAGQRNDADRKKEEEFFEACRRGDITSVKALIEANVDINATHEPEDSWFYETHSALEYAASNGHGEIVNTLITAGIDINEEDECGETAGGKALVEAAEKGHFDIMNALITAGVDLNKENEYGKTTGGKAFVKAAGGGHLDIINALIATGVDLNKENKYGKTTGGKAFVKAAGGGHLDIINALIATGVDLNKEDECGETAGGKALVEAAKKGHFDIMNALITAGVDLNKEDKYGDTVGRDALVEAAEKGHFDIMNALITAGVDLNEENKRGYTTGGMAFVGAAGGGHLDIINALIATGVDLNKEDMYNKTTGGKAFVEAAGGGHLDIISALIATGVDVNKEDEDGETVGGKALIKAAEKGQFDIMNALITAGVNLNKENKRGYTTGGMAFVEAAGGGHIDLIKALIATGVDLNKEDNNGNTTGGKAVVEATGGGHLDIINALIATGVDLNKEDNNGNTTGGNAFVKAAVGGHLDIINALIATGVDLNKEDNNGNTTGGNAFVKAAVGGHLDIINALIATGVDLNKEDNNGNTTGGNVFVKAAGGGHLDIINALIATGVDLNKEDNNGNTTGGNVFVKAAGGGHLDIINALIATGVDLNKEDNNGNTTGGNAFVKAAGGGHLDIINALIATGVDLNKEDNNGNTTGGNAFVKAAGGGHLDIINALIATGVDLNKEEADGNTVGGKALLEAVEEEYLDIVNTLITAGIDLNKAEADGNTVGGKALLEAVEEEYRDIVNTLITAGIDLNKANEEGVTVGGQALLVAADNGKTDMINVLIDMGVDLKEKNEKGETVGGQVLVQAAAADDRVDMVIHLIGLGVDLYEQNEKGETVGGQALVQAAATGIIEMMNVLVVMGVDLKEKNEKGETVGGHALVQAAANGMAGMMNVLIGMEVDLKDKNEKGETVGGQALLQAAASGETNMMNTLIDMGIDLNEKNEKDETVGGQALVQVAANGKTGMMKALIDMGVDLKEKNEKGETVGGHALIQAAANGMTEMMNVIIGMEVDLKEKNEKGETVGGQALVQAAAAYDGDDMVNSLIGLGVDLSEENGTVGENALIKVLETDLLQRNHLKIVDTFVRQEMHMNRRNKLIEIWERKIKQVQAQKKQFSWMDYKTNIAIHYKIYEMFTGTTKEVVIEAMTRDMEKIKDSDYKSEYKKAITCYKDDIPVIITEVRLDDEQKKQMAEAFVSGSERDFCVRSNFVGFTGAGKTTLMWQLFLIIFSPKDIESTNGIDISLGYCSIDLRTMKWKRHEESADEKRARRFQAIAVDKKAQEDESNTSGTEVNNTKPSCSEIQTQPQQQQRKHDNEKLQQKTDTTKEPTGVSFTKTRKPIPARPPTTKSDPYLIIHRIKQAKKKTRRREEEANATGIDYALHQLFLSKRGVNIIVMDGSKDFDENIADKNVRHIGSKQKANSKDFFRFWASSLRYYLPERRSKHIITVFTHKDLVLNQDDLEKKICIVKEMIEEMRMTELFFETVFCVNANDPNDNALQELRHIMLQFSKAENHWGQEMPSSWLLLEDKLMQRKAAGHQVMTLNEVNEIHLNSAFPLGSQDELLLFLKIHHEIGTLMYFADEGITQIVILNPQWLIDSLKLVICADRFRDHRYVKQWDRLREKGVVDRDFLYSVWEDRRKERFYEFREDLILLMNKLDLISSPKKYNDRGDDMPSPYFIIPCMLKAAPKSLLPKYQQESTHRNVPLKFEFEHQFLPTATAYRMLAICVMEFGELQDQAIYCDAAVFEVFENHFMTLEFTCSSIIANIVTFGEAIPNIGVCQGIREFLENTLKCILSSQRTSTSFSLLVACGSEEGDQPEWLKWSDVTVHSEMLCKQHKNDTPHNVKTEEILNQWSIIRPSEGSPQNKRQNSHDKPIPEGKPNHYDLGRIFRRISTKGFHELFLKLGLDQNVIERKECESSKQCVLLLLLQWSRHPDSSYQQLADALSEQQNYTFDIGKIQSSNSNWRKDIPDSFLNQEVADSTDKELDEVCTVVGASYLELGLELRLLKPEIDAIEKDHRMCHPITKHVLREWMDRTRPNDTWEVLGDALYEIEADPSFIKTMCSEGQ